LILFAISFTFLSESRFYLINKLIKGEKAVFISEEKESKLELELANKKLEELSKIAKTQSVEKLAPAINQTKESVAKATQNLVKSKKVNKEIAKKALELENKKKEVEKILGTKITNGEVESPIKFVAQYLIEDLENRSLGEEQRKTFEKAKEYFENGDFTKVIELLLLINNN
jgi:predicted transcriptional regulator